MAGTALRGGAGSGEGTRPVETGRGLATWEAERMNLVSADEGACGTTIFRKQVGHSMCPPLVLESAVMCWPQTGHANLNSLIGSTVTISHDRVNHNLFHSDFSDSRSHTAAELIT